MVDKLAGEIADRLVEPLEHACRDIDVHVTEHLIGTQAALDDALATSADRTSTEVAKRLDPHILRAEQSLNAQFEALDARLVGVIKSDLGAEIRAVADRLQASCDRTVQQAIQRPVIDALLAVHDRFQAERELLAAAYRKDPRLPTQLDSRRLYHQADDIIHSILVEIMAILASLDVMPIDAPAGRFNPKHQQVVAVESTSNPQRDGHVYRIVRTGFRWHRVVLRPERIVVYRFTESADGQKEG